MPALLFMWGVIRVIFLLFRDLGRVYVVNKGKN